MMDACYDDVDTDALGLEANRETNRVIGMYSSIGLHRSVCGARKLAEELVEVGYRVPLYNLEGARHP